MLMHVPLNQPLHYRKLARRTVIFADYQILNVFPLSSFFYRTVSNSMSTTEDPNNVINPPEESSFPLYVMCYCLIFFFFLFNNLSILVGFSLLLAFVV
jgi:hypothetical protein